MPFLVASTYALHYASSMTKQVIVARYWHVWNGCNIVAHHPLGGYLAGPFGCDTNGLKLEAFETYHDAYAHWVKLNNKLDAAESLLWT